MNNTISLRSILSTDFLYGSESPVSQWPMTRRQRPMPGAHAREERMSLDRGYMADNAAQRERLRALVTRLSDDELYQMLVNSSAFAC